MRRFGAGQTLQLVSEMNPNNNVSALCVAARCGDAPAVRALIERGDDVDAGLSERTVPLVLAVPWPDVVALLLRAGAVPTERALLRAIKKREYTSVRLMMAHLPHDRRTTLVQSRSVPRAAVAAMCGLEPANQRACCRIAALVQVAGGVISAHDESDLPYRAFFTDDGSEDGSLRATETLRNSRNKDSRKQAVFDLQREQMTSTCIALQGLGLPALVTVFILRAACSLPSATLRFADAWLVATKVKHASFD